MALSGHTTQRRMHTPSPSSVAEFAPHFRSARVQPTDATGMHAIQRLRFDVYCLERAFLPPTDYPDQLESDLHDATAAHFAAFNLEAELVGCVRLLRPDARQHLPFQSRCPGLLPGVQMPPAAQSAEISRLMVRKDYRRRRGDLLAGVTAPEEAPSATAERRSPTPQIMLSLYREMFRYSLDTGLRYWFAAMERPLARALAHMGFAFKQVGAEGDYFGPVAPYLADLQELKARVGALNPDLLRWLHLRVPAAG